MDEKLGRPEGTSTQLITYITDRAGHDLRYAIDANKIKKDLGWVPQETFVTGLRKTVEWYLANQEWVKHVQSGEYQNWVKQQYQAEQA